MDIKEYISSGILEEYVLGNTSQEESLEIERLAIEYPEIQNEIDEITKTIEQIAISNAVPPPRTVKPFLLATIDYMERLDNGELPSAPPLLNENSKLSDYTSWLNRADMVLPSDAGDLYARIIGHTPEAVTAIVWVKEEAPVEVHHREYERFLIVEGSCDFYVEEVAYPLVAGDYFDIPLHKDHFIKVTSEIPCKVILQRMAA